MAHHTDPRSTDAQVAAEDALVGLDRAVLYAREALSAALPAAAIEIAERQLAELNRAVEQLNDLLATMQAPAAPAVEQPEQLRATAKPEQARAA